MENDFVIRKCEVKDLPDVFRLMEQLSEVASEGNSIVLEEIEKIYHEMEQFPEIYLNLVYEKRNSVIGFISIIF